MVSWKVHVSQFVEETAVLTIEAASLADAIAAAQRMLDEGDDIDWQDGSDVMAVSVDQVTDMDNETLWEAPAYSKD